jgi:hypothetical protein
VLRAEDGAERRHRQQPRQVAAPHTRLALDALSRQGIEGRSAGITAARPC